jgi:hypothetical protein
LEDARPGRNWIRFYGVLDRIARIQENLAGLRREEGIGFDCIFLDRQDLPGYAKLKLRPGTPGLKR